MVKGELVSTQRGLFPNKGPASARSGSCCASHPWRHQNPGGQTPMCLPPSLPRLMGALAGNTRGAAPGGGVPAHWGMMASLATSHQAISKRSRWSRRRGWTHLGTPRPGHPRRAPGTPGRFGLQSPACTGTAP